MLLLVLYAIAAGSYLTTLPLSPDTIHWLRLLTVVLLAAHLLEVVICFRKVALYKGPLLESVLLTLLFGFLHWKPIADAARRTRGDEFEASPR